MENQRSTIRVLSLRIEELEFLVQSLTEANENVPWHRVINRDGKISSRHPDDVMLQRKLLAAEGVEFDKNVKVDLRRFGW